MSDRCVTGEVGGGLNKHIVKEDVTHSQAVTLGIKNKLLFSLSVLITVRIWSSCPIIILVIIISRSINICGK